MNFNVSDSRAAANATGFVHEGIALVESGAVFDETFNVASDTELLAAVGSILARVKRCLVEQLGFDSPPFDAIVERIITGGAACTERVEALTRKIVGRKERVAFEYRLDATGTRLTAILEDAETGGAISTATVLEADYPMSLRGLTRWQSPRVNARDRTIEIRDRKRKIERVIRFES